ncbi:unnamed protein product, partial [marine sediment metagenome]
MEWHGEFIKVDNNRFRIPKTYKPGMRTDGLIYASEEMIPFSVSDAATPP